MFAPSNGLLTLFKITGSRKGYKRFVRNNVCICMHSQFCRIGWVTIRKLQVTFASDYKPLVSFPLRFKI